MMKQKSVQQSAEQMLKIRQELIQRIQEACQAQEEIQSKGQISSTVINLQTYRQIRKTMLDTFIQKINDMSFDIILPKIQGIKYHMVIGPISSGKSSLISKAFNIHLPIGVGQITQQWGVVAQNQNVIMIDAPGDNQDFKFYNIQTLSLFKSIDYTFFCFKDCLKNSYEVLRALNHLNPWSFCVIRTQVDLLGENDCKSVDQELKTDREYLNKLGINAPLYSTSVRKDEGFRDNWQVFNKLRGKIHSFQ